MGNLVQPYPLIDPQAMAQSGYTPGRCNSTYVCIIKADGTFVTGPYGWDVTRTGTGVYVVTHNLGRVNYVAFAGLAAGGSNTSVFVQASDANTVTINSLGGASPRDADCALLIFTTY